jgi:3-methylcrotonyl-CoA carboxylase beta subunit
MWPNARISVMGGAQAAGVLAQVKEGQAQREGLSLSKEVIDAIKQPVIDTYERQGHPYYASARLWDDGVIDPADTRKVLALALCAANNKAITETKHGIFRM